MEFTINNRIKLLFNGNYFKNILFTINRFGIFLYILCRYYRPFKIRSLRNKHINDTFFILGAGPSLINVDKKLFKNSVVIFTNATYSIANDIDAKYKYHISIDTRRTIEYAHEISQSDFNLRYRSLMNIPKNIKLVDELMLNSDIFLLPKVKITFKHGFIPYDIDFINHELENVNLDLVFNFRIRTTVVLNAVDIAFYMGASKVIFLGVDMNYKQDAKDTYFDRKSRWHGAPITDEAYPIYIKPALINYNNTYNKQYIKLFNASENTKEDVLPKIKLKDFIS